MQRPTTASTRRITEQSKFSGQQLLEITVIGEKARSPEQLRELAVWGRGWDTTNSPCKYSFSAECTHRRESVGTVAGVLQE